MSVHQGYGASVNSGLVFAYDTGDQYNSFKGAPTTNIAYSTNSSLNSGGNWWINGASAIFSDNDTSIPKPIIPNVNTSSLRIFSSTVDVQGPNQHIGSSIIPVSVGQTYTFSIYFYFTGTSLQVPPYVRGATNNDFYLYFAYNGDTNYLVWPRNTWIRLSATFTVRSGETGVYMSSYTGDTLGEKLAYFGYQLETGSIRTPLVLGSRSTSQGLFDLASGLDISMSTVSFNSSADLAFDGTDDRILLSNFTNKPVSAITCEALIKPTRGSVGTGTIRGGAISSTNSMYLGIIDSVDGGSTFAMHWANQTTSSRVSNWNGQIPNNAWSHLVGTYDGSIARAYLNSVEIWSTPQSGTIPDASYYIGTYGGAPVDAVHNFNGNIAVAKMYNRALTSAEISSNYKKYKTKFGLP